MKLTTKVVLLIIGLCIFAATVCAQGKCNIQTITGSYAFKASGSSTTLVGESPDLPYHYQQAAAPIAMVGVFTLSADRTGEGQYWIRVGTINSGLTPIPWHGQITELNDDCTGTLEYNITLPGLNQFKAVERFVVLDNGSEIRSMLVDPAAQDFVLGAMTWFTIARRTTQGTGGDCRQYRPGGNYLVQCQGNEALQLPTGLTPGMAATATFRLQVSPSGEFTGTAFTKPGPMFFQGLSSTGQLTFHDDCTVDLTLNVPEVGFTRKGRGVAFDQGRQLYFVPIESNNPVYQALCEANRIDPVTPPPTNTAACDTFKATPSAVAAGEPVTLTWSCENAIQVTIENAGGGYPTSGLTRVYPTVDTTYTLKAYGAPGTQPATATASVKITHP